MSDGNRINILGCRPVGKLPPTVVKGLLTTDGCSWNKNTVKKKGRRLKRGDRRDKESTGGREESWQVEGG